MKKLYILLVMSCIGFPICFDAVAGKQPKIHSVYLEKKRTTKGIRSLAKPLQVILSSDGNGITLISPESCTQAFITISGIDTYMTEMVNFVDQTATLDVSELDSGIYQITVEFENGAIYIGQFEFID